MTTPTTVPVRLKLRQDTAANWTSVNPTLLAGELGRESDTGKIKIGTGSAPWTALAYQAWATLPVAVNAGGTGQTTYTNGQLLIGNTTGNTLTKATLTAGSGVAITNGTGSITVAASNIADAQISATAEIAVSKLKDGAARQLLQTAANGTDVEWASNIDIPGTLDVTGAATFDGAVTVQGDLTVNGTETIINTQTLTVEDKNIELGKIDTPTDATADGGGITLKGTTDKTINWVDATDAWTFSEHVNIASAKEYRIAGTKVLDATSLGSAVVSSSLTSVGTIGTGVWEGTAIADIYLETIATAGKVSNSATTADSANTASAIVARDGSGNFSAGTITAALTGAASSNVLKAGDTMTGALVVPLASASTPSLTFTGDLDTGVFSPGANQVAVATNGAQRVSITSAGALLVGTTATPTGAGSGAVVAQDRMVISSLGAGRHQVIAGDTGTMTATTGTTVFKFKSTTAAGVSCYVKLAIANRVSSGVASNLPAAEYAFQLHRTSAGVCSLNGATTIFEFTYVYATHVAFADLGSGECTVTLTNPTSLAQTGSYKVEVLNWAGAWTLDSVTTT